MDRAEIRAHKIGQIVSLELTIQRFCGVDKLFEHTDMPDVDVSERQRRAGAKGLLDQILIRIPIQIVVAVEKRQKSISRRTDSRVEQSCPNIKSSGCIDVDYDR